MKNKRCKFGACALLLTLFAIQNAFPQGYVKLNGLYALAGIVNPAVEFAVTPKSTLQSEIVISPWKSIDGKHMTFAIFMANTAASSKSTTAGGTSEPISA